MVGRRVSASAGKAAVFQELGFVRCRLAPQSRIAMGKTVEAANNIGMQFRPFQSIGVIGFAIQIDAKRLVVIDSECSNGK